MMPSVLSIILPHATYVIEGRNLEALEELLQNEKVYRIQVFNAKFFDAPEEGMPVITDITVRWGRPDLAQIEEMAGEEKPGK